ncbi:MAG: 4'-phosphopantetheinyl transferase superfamily protein [Elusimicrobia bacterium]|nr:4'-phosphopantetheinyl transferase superfamily protein [Elusimicrobiota bacterium]
MRQRYRTTVKRERQKTENNEQRIKKKNFFIERVCINDIRRPDEILSTEELAKYSSFKIPKRQKEWLAGRLAAKTVINNNLLGLSLNLKQIPITYDANRRPLCLLGAKEYLLSITHSGDWAAAIVKDENCGFLGIDIEKIEMRSKFWIEDYFHKDEIEDGSPERLTKLWTIKEALLKALSIGLTANLLDIKIAPTLTHRLHPISKKVYKSNVSVGIDGEIRFLNKILRHYEQIGKPKFDIISERFSENYYQSIVIMATR